MLSYCCVCVCPYFVGCDYYQIDHCSFSPVRFRWKLIRYSSWLSVFPLRSNDVYWSLYKSNFLKFKQTIICVFAPLYQYILLFSLRNTTLADLVWRLLNLQLKLFSCLTNDMLKKIVIRAYHLNLIHILKHRKKKRNERKCIKLFYPPYYYNIVLFSLRFATVFEIKSVRCAVCMAVSFVDSIALLMIYASTFAQCQPTNKLFWIFSVFRSLSILFQCFWFVLVYFWLIMLSKYFFPSCFKPSFAKMSTLVDFLLFNFVIVSVPNQSSYDENSWPDTENIFIAKRKEKIKQTNCFEKLFLFLSLYMLLHCIKSFMRD